MICMFPWRQSDSEVNISVLSSPAGHLPLLPPLPPWKPAKTPPSAHLTLITVRRPHHQEIIFHAKLTWPTHRDFPLTPRHSSSERRQKMRARRERGGEKEGGRGVRKKGGGLSAPQFLLYGPVQDEWVSNESKMNDSLGRWRRSADASWYAGTRGRRGGGGEDPGLPRSGDLLLPRARFPDMSAVKLSAPCEAQI